MFLDLRKTLWRIMLTTVVCLFNSNNITSVQVTKNKTTFAISSDKYCKSLRIYNSTRSNIITFNVLFTVCTNVNLEYGSRNNWNKLEHLVVYEVLVVQKLYVHLSNEFNVSANILKFTIWDKSYFHLNFWFLN